MAIQYNMSRSKFWIKIHENDNNSINICAKNFLTEEINLLFPQLVNSSPTGWKYKPNNDFYTLWIPFDRLNDDDYEDFKEWCELANSHIWLKLNKNTENHFSGDELDFCIACDWNFADVNSHVYTKIGEAEYQLKYKHYKDEKEYNYYVDVLCTGIIEIVNLISITSNTLITTIPAIESKQDKLSYEITEYLSEQLGIPQLIFTLNNDKPQIKSLTVPEKVEMWNSIYFYKKFNITHNFMEKDIIIVDDLYQSGTSMWAMAKYLIENGANSVRGLVAVKSMRDSDNT